MKTSENEPIKLPEDALGELFPFHCAFGSDWRLLQRGRSIARICPSVEVGARFDELFVPVRPTSPFRFEDLATADRTPFLIRHASTGVLFRGQMLPLGPATQGVVFLGSPWLVEAATLSEYGLTLADFAVHDPVLDLLQIVQAQKMAANDLRKLTEVLQEQRSALRESNDRLTRQEAEFRKLALIAARTDNAVVLTDAHGITEWVNEGFVRLTGYTLGEARGRKPGSLLQGPDTDPRTVRYIREHLVRGEGFSVEIVNYSKRGRKYWVAVEVQPLVDEQGRITNYMGVERDITHRREAEAQLREAKEAAEAANRAKSEFLAMMSHEIRTPMGAIIGMANLLADTALDERQREFVSTVNASSEALLEIINDILDFSKIEAGQWRIELGDFEPRRLVEGVLELLSPRARAKGLRLAAEIAPGVPEHLRSDDGRLRQVLVNLVGNGVKFTEKGEIRIRLSALEPKEGKVRLRFEVDDSGTGITPKEQTRLFQPFTQLSSGARRRQGGTGLGLAISRRIVELLGGQIGVTSTPGQGSTFWFELETEIVARARPEGSPPTPPPALQAAVDASAQVKVAAPRVRILVAEDHETNRRLASLMLDRLGYRADFAGNGLEAVAAWEQFNHDIILMDCQMPELDGFEAAAEIRRREANAPDRHQSPVRIIALTANALAGDREKCLAAGMDDYLSKPVRIDALRAALNRAT